MDIFRADNIQHAFAYLNKLFSNSLVSIPEIYPRNILVFIFLLILTEWFQRSKQHALQLEGMKIPKYVRLTGYYVLLLLIFFYGGKQQEFIYFQF